MIKTLRITSIAAVAVSAVFFVFPAVFGVRSDKQIEEFLNSAGAIEKFDKARGDKIHDRDSRISPLVTQAKAFALYLNPPPEPGKKVAATRRQPVPQPRPPGKVSTKFKLLGTCYYASQPQQSLALIDEPGKGLHWVRQSEKVKHLIIEQVKDGVVVVRDGERTFELAPPTLPRRSLLIAPSAGQVGSETDAPALGKRSRQVSELPRRTATAPQRSPEETALMGKFVDKMKVVEKGESDSSRQQSAMMESLISMLESSRRRAGPNTTKGIGQPRISYEEAKRLGRLGRELKDVQADPNRTKGRSDKIETGSREPNRPEKK